MKQFVLIVLILSASLGYGQNIRQKRVPAEALTQFGSLYPDIKDVSWNKQGKIFIAEFSDKQNQVSVVFDENGKLQQVVNYIEIKDLPKEAQDYLTKYCKQKSIGEISKVKDAKATITFIVEVKSQALVFDANGKFLKVEK